MRNMFVANRMTKNPITVEPTTPVNDAAKLMKQRKIRRLPVVENGQLVGIITETDVFKTFVDVMGLADGKTRLTLDVVDKVGVVKELAGIIADAGYNIDSMVTCKQAAMSGHFEIVIRLDADNVDDIKDKIEAKGYKIIHIAKIGQ